MSRVFWHKKSRKSPPKSVFGRVPPDVLIQIAKQYLEELSTTPLPLMAVCRHWHDTINATSTLWHRVVIYVNHRESIPNILDSPGLERYLSRTDPKEGYNDILLDIEIRCRPPSVEEHDLICKYHSDSCLYALERRHQLSRLLLYLTGSGDYSLFDQASTAKAARITRWGTLAIEWDRLTPSRLVSSEEHPYIFSHPSFFAPRLTCMYLYNLPWVNGFHDEFVPNLKHLELFSPRWMGLPSSPNLRTAVISGSLEERFYLSTKGFESIEDLTFIVDIQRQQPLSLNLANLKILRIRQAQASDAYDSSYWINSFDITDSSGNGRMLDELHLVDVPLPALGSFKAKYLAKISKKIYLQNIRKPDVLLQLPAPTQTSSTSEPPAISRLFRRWNSRKETPSEPTEYHSISSPQEISSTDDIGLLVRFLEACPLDSEVVAVDDASAALLEAARKMVDTDKPLL